MARRSVGFQPVDVLEYKYKLKDYMRGSFAETVAAEANFNAVRLAARQIARDTLLARLYGQIDIRLLEELIDDLISALRIMRGRIRGTRPPAALCPEAQIWEEDYPSLSPSQFPDAPRGATVPHRLTDVNYYRCLCPLTFLLQIIANSLNRTHLDTISANRWGALKPFRGVLVRLQESFVAYKPFNKSPFYYPGFAPCIMLHEEHTQFTVTSTAPSYKYLFGLNTWGRNVRYVHHEHMMRRCTKENIEWVKNMEQLSEKMIESFDGAGGMKMKEDAEWMNPFEDRPERSANVSGFGASVTPFGEYKLACIVDFWRFKMERPNDIENELCTAIVTPSKRGNGSATSCAEWELWIHKLSCPPIQPQPVQKRLPMREGMPKSGTWLTSAQQLDPQPQPVRGSEFISREQLMDQQLQASRQPIATRTFPARAQKKPTPEITRAMLARTGSSILDPLKGCSRRAPEAQPDGPYGAQCSNPPRPRPVDQIILTNSVAVHRPPPQQQRPQPLQEINPPKPKGRFRDRFFK